MWNWSHAIISGDILQHLNPDATFLIEKALKSGKAHLGRGGALLISTGPAAVKICAVEDEYTTDNLDWNKKAFPIEAGVFEEKVQQYLKKIHFLKPELFLTEGSVCADVTHSLGFRIITPSPVHALFTRIFLRDRRDYHPLGDFTVYHDPEGHDPFVGLNFSTKEILLSGASSCGDMELIFSAITSLILMDQGILFLRGRIIRDSAKLSFYLNKDSASCSFGFAPAGLFLIYGGFYRRSIETARFGCIEENHEFLICKETGSEETYPFPDEILSISKDIFSSDKSLLRKQLDYMELLKVLLENTRSTYVISHKEDSHLHRSH